MPSKSKSQQRLFGWALACKRGESKDCPKGIKALADSMSEEELERMAGTKHEGLPEEVTEAIEFAAEKFLESMNEGLTPDDYQGGTPGIEKAEKKYPRFTPSTFKLPLEKKAKHERRIYDFEGFLKLINYKTHDNNTQNGHGQNLTGKASKEGSGIAPIS